MKSANLRFWGKGREPKRETEDFYKDAQWLKRLMSHNFRMPMAIISGYGELLKSGSFTSRQEELDCINKICSNIDYLNTMSKVILDDGQAKLLCEKEYFDILSCIKEVSGYVSMIAQKAGITISVNSSREEILLYANRIAMMRAFFNIIENSVRYMNREGSIFITVEETEDEIFILYRDDGEGMDADEAVYITELNFQGSNGKADVGHGMGMYLVKEAVEGNGGTLAIKTDKGKGMSIHMTFQKQTHSSK